jgi:signal transduction histidine kinase/ActR/RegA family two-component response regulator
MEAVRRYLRDIRAKWKPFAITFLAFLITAQLGTLIYPNITVAPSLLWVPIGIAIAAVLLEGTAMLPAIALAVLANGLLKGTPALLIFVGMIGATVQPLAAYIFAQKTGFDRNFSTVKDMFILLAIALVGTTIQPTIGAGGIYLYDTLSGAAIPTAWATRWLGGALSTMIVTPLILQWIPFPRLRERTSAMSVVETGSILLLLAVSSFLVFGTPYTTVGGISVAFVLLAVLFWAAFRTNLRVMTVSLALMTVISMLGLLHGTHPPAAAATDMPTRILNTETFDLFFALIFFIFVAINDRRAYAGTLLAEQTDKLKEALQRLEREAEAKNEFLATLAHELRNPLSPVMSSMELIELQGTDHPATAGILQSSHAHLTTIARLLDDLLDVSRITRKKFKIQKEALEIQTILRRAVKTTEPFAQNKKHQIIVRLPEESIWIKADPLRLNQVFVNVLYNAVKYTGVGGKIEVECQRQGDSVIVRIRDNGIGIPSDMLDRVFDLFMQVKPTTTTTTTTTPGTGLGIGLSLTKQLVEMHGGDIQAESPGEGNGSEFVIRLPVPVVVQLPIAEEVYIPELSPLRGLSILVVDDNESAARSLGRLLEHRGHRVALAYGWQDALRQAAGHDVALVDIGMPEMNGYDLARLIAREVEQAPALIALSGYGQESDKRKAREAGFALHLTKPVGLTDLEGALMQLSRPTSTEYANAARD